MQGFGASGTGGMPGAAEFGEAARQYWSAWGDMMKRAGAPAAPPAAPGWNDMAAWWSQMAGAPAAAPAAPDPTATAEDFMRRFSVQAGNWYAQMQQLATQFAGKNADPADIAGAWRNALGGAAGNPFAEMFASTARSGQPGFENWMAQISPFLKTLQAMPFATGMGQGEWGAMLGLPAFGFTREHQERVQRLVQAQLDYQEKNNAYLGLMGEAAQNAFGRFEQKLRERSEPGKQLATARALFDLWIDAAEDAYAELALSARFREVYGGLINAQMRMRGAVQREVELMGQLVGMPTRTEMDSAHRKIVQLEREMRRLRDAIAGPGGNTPAPAQRADTAPSKDAAPNQASPAVAARPSGKPPADAAPASKNTSPAGGAKPASPRKPKGKR